VIKDAEIFEPEKLLVLTKLEASMKDPEILEPEKLLVLK